MSCEPELSPLATKQEIFDFVAKKLFAQGKPSLDKEEAHKFKSCRYRAGDLKCGVGFLIPDRLYREVMDEDSLGAGNLIDNYPDLASDTVINLDNKSLLMDLQDAHDNWDLHEDIPGRDTDTDLAACMLICANKNVLNAEVLFTTQINGRILDRDIVERVARESF